jgi:hypothetical protein
MCFRLVLVSLQVTHCQFHHSGQQAKSGAGRGSGKASVASLGMVTVFMGGMIAYVATSLWWEWLNFHAGMKIQFVTRRTSQLVTAGILLPSEGHQPAIPC